MGRRRDLLICLVLSVATFAAYERVRQNEFINYDDRVYLTENTQVQQGLTPRNVVWAFSTVSGAQYWHPLTWLSHMLDWDLFGARAGGHHVSNVVLHVANTLLLYFLIKAMTGSPWASAFVAALFALHPLHVESVAWASERKDTLSALFWILTLWAYLHYARRPGVGRYVLVFAACALGLLSKPMLVTLPFVLLLLDYWPLGRMSFAPAGPASAQPPGVRQTASLARLVVEKLPLFALSVIVSALTAVAQSQGGAVWSRLPITSRLVNALLAYAAYIRKMILPTDLAMGYPHPAMVGDGSMPVGQIVAAALVLVTITALAVALRRRIPYLLVGWLLYLGTLVPVIGFVQVGPQGMADRYTYLAIIGLFLPIALGLRDLSAAGGRRFLKVSLAVTAAAVLLVCAGLSWRQTGYWRDAWTLWTHAAEVVPLNYFARGQLGDLLVQAGKPAEAIEHYAAAVEFSPRDAQSRNSLGNALAEQKRTPEAIEHYLQALKINPQYAEAHHNLANRLAESGQADRAIDHYRKAIQLKPDDARMHHNLALTLIKSGRAEDAAEQFLQAVRLDQSNPQRRFYLAAALEMAGRSREAAEQYGRALKLRPQPWPDAQRRLAWLLATDPDPQVRDPRRAVELAQQACTALRSPHPLFLDTLAAAQAAAGEYAQAAATAQQAIDLAVAAGQERFGKDVAARLALYKTNQPFYTMPPSGRSRP